MRKIETRIKVVKQGEDIEYIPQSKGYIEWWDDFSNFRYFFPLLPLFGQIYLAVIICNFIRSFFWGDLYANSYSCHFNHDIGTLERAKGEIIYMLDKVEEANIQKQPKPKKEVSYIKFP